MVFLWCIYCVILECLFYGIYLFIYLFIYLSIYLFIYLFILFSCMSTQILKHLFQLFLNIRVR